MTLREAERLEFALDDLPAASLPRAGAVPVLSVRARHGGSSERSMRR